MKSLFNLLLICLMGVAMFGCDAVDKEATVKIISVVQTAYETPGGFMSSGTHGAWSVRAISMDFNQKFIFSTNDSDFAALQNGDIVIIKYKLRSNGRCFWFCLKEIVR